MSLFIAMLPIYLFGNLHCLGMCGPLVMMIGQHRYRYFYFLGRTLSFSLAGLIAGAIGAVADAFFKSYHLAEVTSFFFGTILIVLGVTTFAGWSYPGYHWLAKRLAKINNVLALFMLQDRAWPAFLFGFSPWRCPVAKLLLSFQLALCLPICLLDYSMVWLLLF